MWKSQSQINDINFEHQSFLARLDEVQEELLALPPALQVGLAAVLAKSLTLKFFM